MPAASSPPATTSTTRAPKRGSNRGDRPPAVSRAGGGVQRFVAQSYGAWWYVRTGGPVKSEEDPLDPTPAREARESMAAVRHLEQAVLDARWTEGIVLRY